MTAFAPHTIGVNFFNSDYSNDKRLEVIKQFYDVATLFDCIDDFDEVRNSYISNSENELKFRNLNISYKECLLDTFNSALTILLRGENGDKDYANYIEGIRRIRGHIYGESFSSEIARLHASKVMLLAACLYKNVDPKTIDTESIDNFYNSWIKKISSLKKANKTKRAYGHAVAAIWLMSSHIK